jgi:hypothetical protein
MISSIRYITRNGVTYGVVVLVFASGQRDSCEHHDSA